MEKLIEDRIDKGPDRKKGYATGGWICIIIGIIAIEVELCRCDCEAKSR